MADVIMGWEPRFQRASKHPLFVELLSMELAARLGGQPLDEVHAAMMASLVASIDGLHDADPAELDLDDDQMSALLN